jgi:hypothetical protein
VYVLDTQSLSRLSARHPEILQRIRGMAVARGATDGARNARRRRKVRPPSKSKRGAPQAV